MKNLVWLASYPKSGNTWIRACLMLAITGELSLDKMIITVPYFPVLNNVHFKNKKFSEPIEACRAAVTMWNKTQSDLSSYSNEQQLIVKTHQVFGNINNVQFPNLDCACGVIQLVRDPRDVALSYAAHYGRDIDTAIEKLFDEKNSINEQSQPGSFEFISSWELNFLSWQDAAFPKLLIRYEDLLASPEKQLDTIFDFLKLNPKMSIAQIIEKTSFRSLALMEAKNGFKEASSHSKFFRVGKEGQWSILTTRQQEKIEKKFSKTMQSLGYL